MRPLAVGLLPVLVGLPARVSGQQAGGPVVHAVLFFSPTCPHCEQLIRESLPPLLNRYGDRLDIVAISIATRTGADVYRATVRHFLIPESRQGVPTMVVGSKVLVGGIEIPTQLPGLVDEALAGAGIDWPEVPGMRATLEAQGLIDPPEPATPPDSLGPDSIRVPAGAPRQAVGPPDSLAADSAGRTGDPARAAVAADTAVGADTAARIAGAPAPDSARSTLPAPSPPDSGESPGADRGRETEAKPGSGPPSGKSGAGKDSTGAAPSLAAAPPVAPGPSSVPVRGMDMDMAPLSMADRFQLDPVGNSASVAVLFLMAASLLLVAFGVFSPGRRTPSAPPWLIPALAAGGMAVAAYLAWVEVTGTEAVCGPVGDCNTVQQSEHARLFGIPVGLLGLSGYTAILVAWLLSLSSDRTRRTGLLLAWSTALMATLFSAYLTFLEPFVIGATCAWCLTSSLIVTVILLSATPEFMQEFRPGAEGAE